MKQQLVTVHGPGIIRTLHRPVNLRAEVIERISVVDTVIATIATEKAESDKDGDDPLKSQFQYLTYCIPRSISELWLGDLREDREKMCLEGYSKRAIIWATISQFALLLIHWGIHKALDVLMRFKKSKAE
jgi:hypothetical protein